MITTEQVRRRNYIPPEVGDEDVDWCVRAARAQLKSAGVPEFQNNPRYDMLLADLAGFYHYQRAMSVTDNTAGEEAMRRMLNAAVLELRYAEDGEMT